MRVIDHLASEFKKDQGIDLRNDKMALQRLKEGGEKAKIELSGSMETDVNLPFITADASGPKHLNIKLTRAKLEALVDDLIVKVVAPCNTALKDANLKAGDIDEVIEMDEADVSELDEVDILEEDDVLEEVNEA